VAFNALKTTITILVFLDTTAPFHIEADNFDYAMEAVLSQESKMDSK